ncbi:MAG: hypothetical protein BroJett029_20410 [Alphaproteobacteria bacterium]|nr:MAG: hypothetical protein BroJett029_20410 [Alphaproteobacteria bacterium]
MCGRLAGADDPADPLAVFGFFRPGIASGRNREEAIALAVGAEAWSSGAQLVFVTEPLPE